MKPSLRSVPGQPRRPAGLPPASAENRPKTVDLVPKPGGNVDLARKTTGFPAQSRGETGVEPEIAGFWAQNRTQKGRPAPGSQGSRESGVAPPRSHRSRLRFGLRSR